MLNRLVTLTRPLEIGGEHALGIAIYADHTGAAFGARESDEEGVACVDDAARGLVLWCDLWEKTRLPVAREWVKGLLAFCRHMQQADGRFLNFILDWDGVPNAAGITSRPDGASFWHARGARAMAKVWKTFGDERAHADFLRASAHFDARPVASDVRAVQLIGALDAGISAANVSRWSDEIAAQRVGDILLDNHDAAEPHLWAHLQEGVLAIAGTALDRPELVDVARRSAEAYLLPIIDGGFALPTVQPYGAAAAVYASERLHRATGEARYRAAARNARAWFDGRNPANEAIYDRVAGRVADGIDDRVVNRHSGA